MSGFSDSDSDEAPEQVSFDSSKALAREESRQITDLANRDKAVLKQKRRERQELYKKQKLQKLEKESKLSKLVFTDAVLDQIRSEEAQTIVQRPTPDNQATEATPGAPDQELDAQNEAEDDGGANKKRKPIIKSYRSLNIDVRSLPQLPNPRRAAAVAFKAKRFAKVQRESVSMNLIHAEKLRAAGKLQLSV